MATRLKVKEVARNQGINMAKLARKADLDYRTVRKLFRNPYSIVDTDTIDRLAQALAVDASELVETVPDSFKDQELKLQANDADES